MSTSSMAKFSGSPTASPEIIKLAAPLLFAPVFNWALYGVLCVQIYVYSYNFPMDRRPIKFLAYSVFLVETVQTALSGANLYYWFVAGFGNVEHLRNSHLAPINVPVLTAVISFIVQGYFCYRIWVLKSRSSWICGIIATVAVTQLVTGIWASTKSIMLEKYAISKIALYLWAISSTLADILIAVVMTLLLRRACSNFSSFVLIRVVRLTIETNTLTATLAITTLVLYVTFPNEIYFVYTVASIGKVYSNTLLLNLNNRIYFRDHELPRHGDSTFPPIPEGARVVTETPLHFATPEPQLLAIKKIVDILSHSVNSRPMDLDSSRGNSDDTAPDTP
ncbi:hypothetical protein H4582DRAFT_1420289 [Lactarius indigo]|nr:hypothetical protein H4582DRAFT_1420289 [Lactarius indigo]